MSMSARLLIYLWATIAVAGIAAPSHALLAAKCPAIKQTAAECKAQSCEKNAAANLAACAELPFNKSCPDLAELQRRGCYQFCDERYPKERDPQAENCKED
jgi:hypothetical protein